MRILRLSVIYIALFLSGCEQQAILSNVDSRQSIEALLALSENGIHAERIKLGTGRRESYSISVDESDSVSALRVLHEYNLPRTDSESFDSITQSKGFVPNSPEIDALRLDHALASEVERLVGVLPGVVEARAIIRSQLTASKRSKSKKSVEKTKEGPSASLVIRFSGSEGEPPFSVVTVRDIIAQAVPGLLPENIGVTLTRISLGEITTLGATSSNQPLSKITPFRFHIPASEKRLAKFQLLGTMIMCVTVGLLIGVGVMSFLRRRNKVQSQPSRRETTLLKRDFLIEGGIRSNEEPGPAKLPKI